MVRENAMHTAVEKFPRCRWCGKEPEFSPTTQTTRVCEHCGAMQDPVLRFTGPGGVPVISFFVNPDDGLFVEFEKAKPKGETVRYTLSPALLQKAGVPVLKTPLPLNGRFVDRGL